ncbi:MAG: response regulator [Methanobacteriota archaeon]
MTRVLYIDDESSLLTLTQIYLKEEAGLDVEIVSSAEEGLILLKQSEYDAIISDYDMPDINGIELLKMIRTYDTTIPFIIFTGKGREEIAIEALNNGADFYIQKGGDPHTIFTELANAIRHLVRRSYAEKNAIQSKEHLSSFLNALPDLAFIKGPDHRHLLVNTSYLTFLGLKSIHEIIGKSDEEILSPALAEICMKSDEQVRNLNLPISTQETSGGKTYQVTKFPLPFPTGLTGIGGIIRDITDIIESRIALHEANHTIQMYSGIIRDDILNQINIISLATDKLHQAKAGGVEGSQYLEMISNASQIIKDRIYFPHNYQEIDSNNPI